MFRFKRSVFFRRFLKSRNPTDVDDDYEPELEALVDEASIGEEATIPAL